MRHFIVEINYTAPMEKISSLVDLHRAFLQAGYDQGMLLMSGPKNPRTGGMLVARARSLEDLERFFDDDPYKLNSSAEYQFIEFEPVKYQQLIKPWLENSDL